VEKQMESIQEGFAKQLASGRIPMAQWDVKWKQAHEKQTMLKCEIEKYKQQLDEDHIVLERTPNSNERNL
jgi:hypothetical protein